MIPPETANEKWKVTYSWQGKSVRPAVTDIDPKALRGGKVVVPIAFDSDTKPGVSGQLRFVVSEWNPDAMMED